MYFLGDIASIQNEINKYIESRNNLNSQALKLPAGAKRDQLIALATQDNNYINVLRKQLESIPKSITVVSAAPVATAKAAPVAAAAAPITTAKAAPVATPRYAGGSPAGAALELKQLPKATELSEAKKSTQAPVSTAAPVPVVEQIPSTISTFNFSEFMNKAVLWIKTNPVYAFGFVGVFLLLFQGRGKK